MMRPLPPSLSDNHRRTLSTTLSMLDEMLCDFEERSRDADREAILFRRTNTLMPAELQVIDDEAARMRALLRELREDLHLTGAVRDVRTSIRSRAFVFWENLHDLETRRLKAYGDVPDGLAEYLDPRLRELNLHLMRIAELGGTSPPAKPPREGE
jgi:hypothetical protein